MHVPRSPRRWSVAALAAVLSTIPLPSLASLARVGPTTSSVGYPQWYQDATGITLELCSPTNAAELSGGWCLLLPADTVAPESFPGAFADEHFYWAADAVADWSYGGTTGGARLILGLEAAFATGPVVSGDQIVFGRVRIRIDDLPLSGTYTVYTPYGAYVFPDQVAGERLFFTEDIGITCAQGTFDCALQSSIGPFLLASDTPGGAELPPVAGPVPGRLYLADPARSGPVTGSPLPDYVLPSGETRNPNLFRIEGPGGVELLETTAFTLVGRIFSGEIPGEVRIDRADYHRRSEGSHVDVFATAFPGRDARLPAGPISEPVAPELSVYPATCGGAPAPDGGVEPPYAAPLGVGAIAMARSGSAYWARSHVADVPAGVCVAHTNARSSTGEPAPAYLPAPLGDRVYVSSAIYDPGAGTLSVEAFSGDELSPPPLTLGAFGDVPNTPLDVNGQVVVQTAAPPAKVRVRSDEGGSDEMQVIVAASAATVNAPPEAVADAAQTVSNVPVAVAVLDNDADPDGDALRLSAVTQPANGAVQLDGETVVYAPLPSFVGTDAFTYTVTDDRGGFSTGAVVVTVGVAENVSPVANPDVAVTAFEAPVAIAVLANDSDANADPLFVSEVTQPAEGAVTHDGRAVLFVPAAGFSGIASFTYTVSDGRGASAVGVVTVEVRPAETFVITRAMYRNPEWRIEGLSSVEGATVTIHAGSTLDGPVIGTATVEAGAWRFRSTTVPGSPRISLQSTGGTTLLDQIVTIR